ncbi:uncharacterized protein CTRU02_200129 [Colletotrichum truncatum]|uniref:Uncharacterized protein n=1 Tax=Colletotrichum truncatum TaxID=5467 RepID=A0ACC3ZE82_COLTU|nr:uncharacterized protein CTRU02_05005 [Colletotrichum truncatum]KAF6794804.1 hypothetical protein CTRU02_05005 [Colletotrichum truncatum]
MKKKSMSTLASLASRRRDRSNNPRAPEPRETTNLSVPVLNTGAGHGQHPMTQGSQDQTIDRLASALLESTIYNHPNGLASHPSVLLCGIGPISAASAHSPANTNMAVDSHDHVVVVPFEEGVASEQSRTQTSETVDLAPAIPRKSSRRRAKRNTRHDISEGSEVQLSKQPFPQSKTSILDTGKKYDVPLTGSTTAPLGGLAKEMDSGMLTPAPPIDNHIMINDKVAAMLAATEALKPRGSQNSTPANSSKSSRFRTMKVISKVRKVLDVFQPNTATPKSKIRGKISAPIALTTCDLPNPAAHFHIEEVGQASPVSSIEIRLNEGNNLNNQKVRSIVGGRILRKPVSDDGRSLLSGGSSSSDDPFSGPHELVRTPTPFEYRLKSSLDSTNIPPIPSLNPFDSEKGFDDDLEGFLSEKPLCASTPRVRSDKKAVPLESPSRRYAKIDDRHLTTLAQEEGVSSGINQRKLKLDLEGVRLFHDKYDLGTKKHPSPSKDDLDDLETQFRAYAILQIQNAPANERDALTTKFAGLIGTNALTLRDKNLPMKACSAKENITDDLGLVNERKHHRESSVISSRQSRIPRPIEPVTSLPTRRFGPQYQPTNSDALEIDELQ